MKQYVQLVGRGVIGVRAERRQVAVALQRDRQRHREHPHADRLRRLCLLLVRLSRRRRGPAEAGEGRATGIQAEEVYYHPAQRAAEPSRADGPQGRLRLFWPRHNNGFPVCVELATGKIAWGGSERGPGSGSAAITYADGHVVFRYQSGEVALIEATPSAYKLKGSFKPDYVSRNPCWAQPVVIDGKLYLRDQDKLMCYDVRE